MADDEVNERAAGIMDLNLYLGLPLSPRPRVLDLGSDLALAPSPSTDAEYDPSFPSFDSHYSPSDDQSLLGAYQFVQEANQFIQEADQPTAEAAPYDPMSPPYVPLPGSRQASPIPVIDIVGDDDDVAPLSSRELAYRPESRFQRLIESSRRFRSSPPSPAPVRLLRNIMSSHRYLQAGAGKSKAGAEGCASEGGQKEEAEENGRNAANFECNICLDMAMEPVVTSCGHLFCWPCLYQWLHVHSEHKECPVCKGEVVDANVTPIYGRGSSEDSMEKKGGKEVELGVKIPPRPRGNRPESFRQQLIPFSRRLGEGIASWRRRIDERMRLGSRNERHAEASPLGTFTPWHHGGLNRLRLQTAWREEGNPASGSSNAEIRLTENNAVNPQNSDTSSFFQDDLWHRFSFYGLATDRLAALTADLSSLVGRFASSNNRYGASVATPDPLDLELQDWHPVAAPVAGDQASASSTMAVIEGDNAVTGALADLNSAGSSRSLRRSERNGNLTSLDVDGGGLHGHKRRRLN